MTSRDDAHSSGDAAAEGTRALTIAAPVEVETEARRSRFLCRLEPVETEAAARAVVDAARRQHWSAGHHCSAIILGPPGPQQVQRSSDDGEPSGTAGQPMLDVLRGRGLSDLTAVVTRWFGGTLLGAGGLVRAYSDAVREACDAASLVERRLLREVSLEIAHADAGRVEHDLRSRGVQVLGTDYAQRATVRAAVPAGELPALHAAVAETTFGAGRLVERGDLWVTVGARTG